MTAKSNQTMPREDVMYKVIDEKSSEIKNKMTYDRGEDDIRLLNGILIMIIFVASTDLVPSSLM